jgi:hypothetical protein
MKRTAELIILTALVVAGCAGTRTIKRYDTFDSSFRQINEETQNESVFVRPNDRVVLTQHLQLTPDSSSWVDVGTGRIRVVASSQIREIRFSKDRRRARLGWVMGALFGVHWDL